MKYFTWYDLLLQGCAFEGRQQTYGAVFAKQPMSCNATGMYIPSTVIIRFIQFYTNVSDFGIAVNPYLHLHGLGLPVTNGTDGTQTLLLPSPIAAQSTCSSGPNITHLRFEIRHVCSNRDKHFPFSIKPKNEYSYCTNVLLSKQTKNSTDLAVSNESIWAPWEYRQP